WFCYCVFFFFQAEDGIRDGHVTGVQTCALPIYGTSFQTQRRGLDRRRGGEDERPHPIGVARPGSGSLAARPRHELLRAREVRGRSEERRVGKEGRCRWVASLGE